MRKQKTIIAAYFQHISIPNTKQTRKTSCYPCKAWAHTARLPRRPSATDVGSNFFKSICGGNSCFQSILKVVLIIHIYSIQNRGRNTFEVLLHHALPHCFFTYFVTSCIYSNCSRIVNWWVIIATHSWFSYLISLITIKITFIKAF
jgi:hypothetical protein